MARMTLQERLSIMWAARPREDEMVRDTWLKKSTAGTCSSTGCGPLCVVPEEARDMLAAACAEKDYSKAILRIVRLLGFVPAWERGYEQAFYVARSTGGLVKVGISAKPFTRVYALGQASGRTVTLAALFPMTGAQLEAATKARFADRMRHEWIKRDEEVDAFVDACALVAPPPEEAKA